jgi:hypothetical protein
LGPLCLSLYLSLSAITFDMHAYMTFIGADDVIGVDIDDPIVLPSTGGASGGASKPEPSAEQITMLADMGFTSAQARKALQETVRLAYTSHSRSY